MSNKRAIGSVCEKKAADYLQENGYHILQTNFFCRSGEVDIIAEKQEYLIFCEVKYRKNDACGTALEAVDVRKQKKICKAALQYCRKEGYGADTPCRFDVIALEGETLTHIENAFDFLL